MFKISISIVLKFKVLTYFRPGLNAALLLLLSRLSVAEPNKEIGAFFSKFYILASVVDKY